MNGEQLVNLTINGRTRAVRATPATTLLTLAPSLLMMMTCFTRIVIVLGFVRTALGVPNAPANQIVMGLSLFLTLFIMGPVWRETHDADLTWRVSLVAGLISGIVEIVASFCGGWIRRAATRRPTASCSATNRRSTGNFVCPTCSWAPCA